MTRRFVLLDRDGTVMVDRHYLADPNGVELIPGAARGLRELQDAGFGLVVITNQSGIARGLFDEATLGRIHRRLTELLASAGVQLDGIYYCPHGPSDGCACRKPGTGLVDAAVADHHFDPRSSFVVGDNLADIQLSERLGATSILVQTGYGAELAAGRAVQADHVAPDLEAAAALIIGLNGRT